MRRTDAILGGVAIAIVLNFLLLALEASAQALPISAEAWSAIAAVLLVFVTILLVIMARVQIHAADNVAKLQIEAADKLATKQQEALRWMEEQKTKPYCEFVLVRLTSTDKSLGCYLVNYGHGPAVKMRWKFYHNETPITVEGREGFRRVVSEYNLNNEMEVFFPSILAATSEQGIFRERDEHPSVRNIPSAARDERQQEIRDLMDQINIELTFESIMGEEQTIWLHDTPERPAS